MNVDGPGAYFFAQGTQTISIFDARLRHAKTKPHWEIMINHYSLYLPAEAPCELVPSTAANAAWGYIGICSDGRRHSGALRTEINFSVAMWT